WGQGGMSVVIDSDEEIVEMVIAPKPVAGLLGQAPKRTIVAAAVGIFAPGQIRFDASHRQQRGRPLAAVGPPPQPHEPEPAARGRAVPFKLVGADAGSANDHRNGAVAGKQYAAAAVTRPRPHPDQGEKASAYGMSQTVSGPHVHRPSGNPACSFAPECSTSRNTGLPARLLQGL